MVGGRETLGVFNLGTQYPEISIREVAKIIVELTGKSVKLVDGPTTKGSPVRRCPDMMKTSAACGFVSEISLKEGIRKTLTWYEDNIFKSKGLSAL
jgi:nucleoside-diphosphate-sugar epimerase